MGSGSPAGPRVLISSKLTKCVLVLKVLVSKFPVGNNHYLVPAESLLTALELGTLSSNDPLQLSVVAT